MNIVKVLTPHGETIATYPDAYAIDKGEWICVFDAGIPPDERDFGAAGNWIAAFTGTQIIWEEKQVDHNESIRT
jgi:hypothetical protein